MILKSLNLGIIDFSFEREVIPKFGAGFSCDNLRSWLSVLNSKVVNKVTAGSRE